MTPPVGSTVQFFTKNLKEQYPNVGVGPYAAIVTQVYPTRGVELRVLVPGHGLDYTISGVFEKNTVEGDLADEWYDSGPHLRT